MATALITTALVIEGGVSSNKSQTSVQYRDINNPKVAKAGTKLWTGRKWRAEQTAKLHRKKQVGVVTLAPVGLGSFLAPHINRKGVE